MWAGAAITEEVTPGLRRGAPTEARERWVGAKVGAPAAQVAGGAALSPRVDTGEEQEDVWRVSDEPATATREQTGVTTEPRRSALRRAEEGRVDARREESTAQTAVAEEAALRRRMGAGEEWTEVRIRGPDGGGAERGPGIAGLGRVQREW